MSAEPIHASSPHGQSSATAVVEVTHPGPYRDTPTEVLLDSLEHQHDEGLALDILMVGELGGRLLDAERELVELRQQVGQHG
jgi:hypothetical protein